MWLHILKTKWTLFGFVGLALQVSFAKAADSISARAPDARTPQQVAEALSASGIKNSLLNSPIGYVSSVEFKKIPSFLPFGNVSHAVVVGCSEGNLPEYPIWTTDRYGFNNDDTVYSFNQRILLVGDALAAGACVHQEQTIAGTLRRSGYPTVSLGVGGFGPILTLAALAEYGERFKPKVILWTHQAANISHLQEFELRSTFVLQYLKDGFTQKLAERQQEIDAFWNSGVAPAAVDESQWGAKLDENLALVRSLLGDDVTSLRDDQNLYRIFGRVLAIAQRRAQAWGGRIYLVLIPRRVEFQGEPQLHRQGSLEEASKAHMPVIDLDPVIRSAGDPLRFTASKFGFLNPEGYALLSREIGRRLSQDHALP